MHWFNIGKLYEIKKYFWMLYPTKEKASPSTTCTALQRNRSAADLEAKYWSEQLNCTVSHIPENELITILEQNNEYVNVLSSDGAVGWIVIPDEYWVKNCFEEVKL